MSTRTTIGIGVLGAMGIGLLIASAAGMRGATAVAMQEAPSALAGSGDVSSGIALAPSPSNGSNELTLFLGRWLRVFFFDRAEVSCFAIDAGPHDCFVTGDGEVIRRKQ